MIHFIIISSFIFFSSCTKESITNQVSKEGMPDQESWGVNITLTDGGIIRAKVESGHLAKYSDNASLLLDSNIIVDFYDKDEKHTSTLTSFRAEVNQSSNDMKASGNVIATSDSGITLFSESLTWLSESEKLYTKDSIMITTIESDTIYGIGFESDSDLKNWKIIQPSGVTGKEYK